MKFLRGRQRPKNDLRKQKQHLKYFVFFNVLVGHPCPSVLIVSYSLQRTSAIGIWNSKSTFKRFL